ncbi:leucyl/phenylalanyl-tRNA--protein transferase [Parvularcula sp. LCG005]|uniref:leucyl/phenylalanyl-tRNA--protein transferase n=1 Tax=Parvularcula sp. LCG005 TaxID=3078805 RepID=UPI002941FB59|nr:leucyl/phenylalanyl-tRNA--protein transferase [Parvularcula sp. LCG005]WOI54585.1 leucyl/phenylalanyl-tRNA--protein transferase [Parvularcula sp. LCG005]
MPDDDSAPQKLTPELLLQAYQIGYFPMADDATADEIYWVHPELRGVIPLDRFHISKSLRKTVRQDRYIVTSDTDFRTVMQRCAEPQAGRRVTWINEQILEAYTGLFELGFAHSVETRTEDGTLVGGLYGVSIGGAFFGESMFSRATDASKVALVHLVAKLRAGGYRLLDTQFQNDHLVQFGTMEVPADDYQILLADAVQTEADFAALPDQMPGSTILQSITQTS